MTCERIAVAWAGACALLAAGSVTAWARSGAAAGDPRRAPQGTPGNLVVEDATDAGAQALGLSVCRVYVQFGSADDRLLSVGFAGVTTDDPLGFFQVAPPSGGDSAPLESAVLAEPELGYDSFVTIGLGAVPDGTTDGTAVDPDFDSVLFGGAGALVGGWFNVPPTNGQGQPGEDLRVLIAQLSIRTGYSVSGSASAFCNDGTQVVSGAFFYCTTPSTCGDQDGDGRRDEACAWYDCVAGGCVEVARTTQADIGGQFGDCPTDDTCDGNDRFHALNCFSNQSATGVTPYPCEPDAPAALNVDAGGPATCVLDGVCDANDAFHALNCFSELWFDGSSGYQCGCAGPAPSGPAVALPALEQAGLVLRAPARVRPGAVLTVDVHLGSDLQALRGYQLHLGTRGGVELLDMQVDARREDYAFAGAAATWSAFNRETAQMIVGMDAADGLPARSGAYLGTYVYRVPEGADPGGEIVVDVLRDGLGTSPQNRTFLYGAAARPIDVNPVTPARIGLLDTRASR